MKDSINKKHNRKFDSGIRNISSSGPDAVTSAERSAFMCELISFHKAVRLSRVLARKIKLSGYQPDLIIAIGRGGFVPGRLLADFLLFNNLTSIKIEHYKKGADMAEKARIRFPVSVDITGKKVLIVDDITDTGDTLALAVEYVKSLNPSEIKTAVLQHKLCSAFAPDYYAQKIRKWCWIIYPWALYEDLAGFAEKILQGKALTCSQILREFKSRYDIELKARELLELLEDLSERGEIKKAGLEKGLKGEEILWRI